MSNANIYVGNLSYQLNSDSLQKIFEEYGSVKTAKVVTDYETGRSKGFGFVEMEESTCAERAIESLNGTDLDGRVITVNEARPRKPRNNYRD